MYACTLCPTWKYTVRTISALGICTASVTNWRCIRGVMLKEPAVGFMQAAYWLLMISFSTILALSYLCVCVCVCVCVGRGERGESKWNVSVRQKERVDDLLEHYFGPVVSACDDHI